MTIRREVIQAIDIRADRFTAVYSRSNDANFTTEYYYGFAWIAIGR